MKIRMKTRVAGPDFNVGAGQVVDLPTAQAYDFIERGYAEQISTDKVEGTIEPEPEKPVAPAAETAVDPAAEVAADVSIPKGWKKLGSDAMKALAASLGVEAKNKKEAKAVILAAGG